VRVRRGHRNLSSQHSRSTWQAEAFSLSLIPEISQYTKQASQRDRVFDAKSLAKVPAVGAGMRSFPSPGYSKSYGVQEDAILACTQRMTGGGEGIKTSPLSPTRTLASL